MKPGLSWQVLWPARHMDALFCLPAPEAIPIYYLFFSFFPLLETDLNSSKVAANRILQNRSQRRLCLTETHSPHLNDPVCAKLPVQKSPVVCLMCVSVCVGVCEAQHGWLSEVSMEVIKKRQGDSTIFVSSIRESVQGKAEYPPVSLIRYTVCLSHTTPFPLGASTWWTQQSVFGTDLCVKSVRNRVWVWQIN